MRIELVSDGTTRLDSSVYDACVGGNGRNVSKASVSLPVPSGSYTVLPGFCDVHVHFREPGFSYKETFATGTAAAAAGGFTDVCTMPNLMPVPDTLPHMKVQTDLALAGSNGVRCHPYAALTVGERGEEPADIEGLAGTAVAFSDDGRGVQDGALMKSLMERVRDAGGIIAAHCEDNTLVRGGYIHDGAYCAAHGHAGICSESEWRPIARDLSLAAATGCPYHVCHVSCAQSVELIRQAKATGVDVTCETGPHYLVFSDRDLCEDGRFKMNPPLRSPSDREALIEGVLDGTVDMIATDHAPHSAEEKSRGLAGSAFGIVGLETAFPAMYTHFVRTGLMTLRRLAELMCDNPKRRFRIPETGDFSLWDLDAEFRVDPSKFLSKGRATPFDGTDLYGKHILTYIGGRTVRPEVQ